MIEKIKNQSLSKLMIMAWNIIRMVFLKIQNGNKVKVSIIENISPDTVISVKKGTLHLSHSVFTRKNVTLRVEGGFLEIGTSFFNQGCNVVAKKKIIIGDDCLFGPNVVIVDHDHDYRCADAKRGVEYLLDDVIIGNNVVVGANTVILKGTHIGDNCMIGAGSIVNGNIPYGTLYYMEKYPKMKEIKFKGYQ